MLKIKIVVPPGLAPEEYYTALAKQDPRERRKWLEGSWEIDDGHKRSGSV